MDKPPRRYCVPLVDLSRFSRHLSELVAIPCLSIALGETGTREKPCTLHTTLQTRLRMLSSSLYLSETTLKAIHDTVGGTSAGDARFFWFLIHPKAQ